MAVLIYNNLPFDENDLKDDVRNAALGRFMTAWSQAESVWAFLFIKFMDLSQPIGHVLFEGIKTRDQLDILTKLVEFLPDEDDRASMVTVIEKVSEISVKRNKIVHSLWGTFNGEPARYHRDLTSAKNNEIMYESDKGKSLRGSSIFTVNDLNTITEQIVELRGALINALYNIKPEPGPKTRDDLAREADWERRRQERNAMFAQQSAPPPSEED